MSAGSLSPNPRRGARRLYRGAVLSGFLLAAATAQLGLGLVAFVALVPFLSAIDAAPSPRRAAGAGWVCGVIFFTCALAWVPLSGQRGWVLTLAGAYVLVIALSWAGLAAFFAGLRRHSRALFLASVPLAWVSVEVARSQGPGGSSQELRLFVAGRARPGRLIEEGERP